MAEIRTKYSVGDVVYKPTAEMRQVKEPCPDCLGEKCWNAKLPSGEDLIIKCPTCERGYEGSSGMVTRHEVTGIVERLTIGSVRFDSYDGSSCHGVEYMCRETGVGSGSIHREAHLYPTEADAQAVLPQLVEERTKFFAESNAKTRGRKRSDRPGSMASYYREQIRRAKKEIKQAEAGLLRERPEKPEVAR